MKKFLFVFLILFAPSAHALPVSEITSPDGLSIWYVEDKTTPSLTLSFAFKGGTELDPADKQGATALFANMLTESTGNYSSSDYAQALAEKNISLSYTAGRDIISGDLRFLLSHKDEAIGLTRLSLTQPQFTESDLNRQKATFLASFRRNENDPDWRATRLLFQNIYGSTPYAQSSRGTPTTVPNITTADLKAMLGERLVKSRLMIVAVGAAAPEEAGTIVDQIFGSLPDGTDAPKTKIEIKNPNTVWFSQWAQAPQAVVQFALTGIRPNDDDYLAAMILNDILGGGGFRARLMKELRQKLGATYGIGTNQLNLQAAPVIYGEGSVDLSQMDAAVKLIRDTLATTAKFETTKEELEASKTYLAGAFARDLVSSSAIADFVLAARLSGLPSDYYETYPDRIRKVDEADLKRVAQRLFDGNQLRFAIVAPKIPTHIDKTVTDLWAVNP